MTRGGHQKVWASHTSRNYLPEQRERASLSYPRYIRQLDIGKAYELYP